MSKTAVELALENVRAAFRRMDREGLPKERLIYEGARAYVIGASVEKHKGEEEDASNEARAPLSDASNAA